MLCFDSLRERSQDDPLLYIIVGESGAGKTTFSNFVNRPEGYYSSSGSIEAELLESGSPINHDTIHAKAQELYSANQYWQVPLILGSLATRPYLILDGPRRVNEVAELRRQHANTWILRIATAPELRQLRLKRRDDIDDTDVSRVVHDENKQLEIEKILAMADETITNDDGMTQLRDHAYQLRVLLDSIKEDREQCLFQEATMTA
jgi:dephospho-CoA kinase